MSKNRVVPFLNRRRVSHTRSSLEAIVLAKETPYAQRCYYALQERFSGRYNEIPLPDPLAYRDWITFKHDYLCYNVFRKSEFFRFSNVDRKKVALGKFLASESLCEAINHRFKGGHLPLETLTVREEVRAVLFTARRKIAQCLGSFSWDLASQHFRFGPGATFRSTSAEGDVYYKLGIEPTTTVPCYQASLAALRASQSWLFHLMEKYNCGSQDVLRVVPGNRVVTVPKDSNVDRVIAIEPLMNLWIQFGIGGLMRKRLRRVGIDLKDQTVNQRLAQEGSRTGRLATIDLSSASDSIARNLVEALLPQDWWSAILLCRSQRGVLPDGTMITYQKVSSMGNGFTFELESLLFWALCSAVEEVNCTFGNVSVYGDDIVIPVESVGLLTEVFTYCGFTVNAKKSFSDGPFRESCGKHYFRGHDVSPFFVKKEINSDFQLLRYLNRVRQFSACGFPYGRDGAYEHCWHNAYKALPGYVKSTEAYEELGDVGVWRDFDEAVPRWNRNLQCYSARVIKLSPVSRRPMDVQFLLRGLYSMDRRAAEPEADLQDSVVESTSRYKTGAIPTSQWPSIGPWIHV